MEQIKNILSDIQERFRNPLFSSFIISWVLWNWEISILVIHFLTDSKTPLLYNDLINIINSKVTIYNSLIFPLFSSFVYLVLLPFVKIGIAFLQAWFERHQNEFELKGSKDGSVSVNKYISLRNQYVSKIEELKKIIDNEDVFRKDNLELKKQIDIYTESEKKINLELAIKIEKNNAHVLDGFWEIKINSLIEHNEFKDSNSIKNRSISSIDKMEIIGTYIKAFRNGSNEVLYTGNILFFEYLKDRNEDSNSNYSIIIYCELIKNKNRNDENLLIEIPLIFKLKQFKNFEYLEGTIDKYSKIIMVKNKK